MNDEAIVPADKAQRDAANWLLQQSAGQHEDSIRQRVGNLLDSLAIEYELSYRSPYSSGPCDIYLPRRRTVIETKALGGADNPDKPQARKKEETPKQQLDRYVHAEIEYELRSSTVADEAERPWSGVLTDGRVWHVWRYPNERDAVGSSIGAAFRPGDADALIDHLGRVLEGELVGKPWIPPNPRTIFESSLSELSAIFEGLPNRVQRSTETKRALWLEMLRTSSMEPENELAALKLFVAHSFLVTLARGVIQVLTDPAATPDPEKILGNGFVAWIVQTAKGKQWAERLFQQIFSYEWRRRPGDVLRPLYEHFVDPEDRKVYGEFYTPDWLAQLVVREVCDEKWCQESVDKALVALRSNKDLKGVGVLDPTCGSGTFLYHAALRLLSSPNMKSLSNTDRAAVVCMLVNGIDIHPVAAEIARATLLRALPSEPPQGESALRVYEGDALLLQGDDESSLFRPLNGEIRIETPKARQILLPRVLVDQPTFVDDLRRLVVAATSESEVPEDLLHIGTDVDRQSIIECHRQFIEIVRKEGNSVWTWYIRNIIGPYRLAETKINRIVANPPWVKMADIQPLNRKRGLEEFASNEVMQLWTGGIQAPHFDIAQLFIKRCRQEYLESPSSDPGGWVVKKSAMKAGNWGKFRSWHQTVLKQSLDLEHVQPFGGGDARRCCVLFEARKTELQPKGRNNLVAKVAQGPKPSHSDQLDDVLEKLSIRGAPPAIPKQMSDFTESSGRSLFKQGATITPKVLTVVDRVGKSALSGCFHVTTVRSSNDRWKDVNPQEGDVPSEWVRNLIVSKKLLPFALDPSWNLNAIVPITAEGRLDKDAARNNTFWDQVNAIYEEQKGGGRNTPATLISQIDYSSKLSVQLMPQPQSGRRMVIYPSSGDIMRGCRSLATEGLIDATLYRFIAPTVSEAAYLVALLNAPCLNDAFVESRESGRDFHLHPWKKIPIRRYDNSNPHHVELTRLTMKAERLIDAWLASSDDTAKFSQVGLSSRARSLLEREGVLQEIDENVRQILPRQSRRL